MAAVSLAGCSGSAQTGAAAFIEEHVAGATRAAAATKAIEVEVASLSKTPTKPQLEQLARAAGEGHRDVVRAQAWNVAEGAEEGEDLPLAESQIDEGANELAKAMSVLMAYASAPRAAALARSEASSLSGANGGTKASPSSGTWRTSPTPQRSR